MGESSLSTSSLRLLVVQTWHRWRRHLFWAVGALGAVAFALGAVVLFTSDHDARSGFLLSLGLGLALIVLLGGRVQLEGFEILGAKVRVREVVKSRLELATSPEHGGGVDRDKLRNQADVLQKLVGLYGLYEHVRHVEPPGPERTKKLDGLALSMQQAGRKAEFDPVEVIEWFHEGTDPLRVIALNLMLVNSEYRDFLAVIKAIDDPHSLFEQYYAMRVGEAMLPNLDPLQRQLLADGLSRARKKHRLRRDPPLKAFSKSLLDQIGKEDQPV
jgi:hypothetical protein